jgi:hypothetical protein
MLKICLPQFEEQGHVYSLTQVIDLARRGKIDPDTMLENKSGQSLRAGSIRGIKFRQVEPESSPQYHETLEQLPFTVLVKKTRTSLLNYFAAISVILVLQFVLVLVPVGLATRDPLGFWFIVGVGLAFGAFLAVGVYRFFTLLTVLGMEVILAIDDIRQELKKRN